MLILYIYETTNITYFSGHIPDDNQDETQSSQTNQSSQMSASGGKRGRPKKIQ